LVFGPKPVASKGDLKLVVPSRIGLATQTDAHLTLDGNPVPNSDVIWGAQGAAWIDQGGTLHPLELGRIKLKASAYGKLLVAESTVVEKVRGRSPAPTRR
jgi:hypothetical protein